MPGAITVGGGNFNPLARPESIQWDSKSGYWYVSNQGLPTDPNDGYISQLNPDGSIAESTWATGLGHPLGIRIFQDLLYVADRDHTAIGNGAIVVFDLADGTLVKTYSLNPSLLNAGGPNDPVVDKKTDAIYVSVFSLNPALGNTVLKVPLAGDGSDASQLAAPGSFGPQPNGTLLSQHDLIVINSDGEFLRVDLDSGSIETLGSTSFLPPPGVLDGIERDGGGFLFTLNGLVGTNVESFLAKIRFQPDGTVKEQKLCTLPADEGAADIGINRDTGIVAIPHLFAHKITFVNLEELTD